MSSLEIFENTLTNMNGQAENIVSIIVAMLAFLLSIISLVLSVRFSRISVMILIQDLGLNKAKECNQLWSETLKTESYSHNNDMLIYYGKYIPVINEVRKSIALLENSIMKFKQSKMQNFFLEQFWIQLDFGLREFLSRDINGTHWSKETLNEILFIKKTLRSFFRNEDI